MYFTGDFIDAKEAYRLGALESVVDLSELRDTAMAIAAKIATKSSSMIQLAKEALTGIEDGNLEDKISMGAGVLHFRHTPKATRKKGEMLLSKNVMPSFLTNKLWP